VYNLLRDIEWATTYLDYATTSVQISLVNSLPATFSATCDYELITFGDTIYQDGDVGLIATNHLVIASSNAHHPTNLPTISGLTHQSNIGDVVFPSGGSVGWAHVEGGFIEGMQVGAPQFITYHIRLESHLYVCVCVCVCVCDSQY
jgi:hypothetical protein